MVFIWAVGICLIGHKALCASNGPLLSSNLALLVVISEGIIKTFTTMLTLAWECSIRRRFLRLCPSIKRTNERNWAWTQNTGEESKLNRHDDQPLIRNRNEYLLTIKALFCGGAGFFGIFFRCNGFVQVPCYAIMLALTTHRNYRRFTEKHWQHCQFVVKTEIP